MAHASCLSPFLYESNSEGRDRRKGGNGVQQLDFRCVKAQNSTHTHTHTLGCAEATRHPLMRHPMGGDLE